MPEGSSGHCFFALEMMKHSTNTHSLSLFLALALAFTTSAVGCESDDPGDDPSALDIAGTYDDAYGQTHVIGEATWTVSAMDYSSSFEYVTVDEDSSFIIAQNSAENDYSGGLFSRMDWVFDAEGSLHFCQCIYDALTPEDALACESDRDDLTMGCAGFAWSLLTPQ